MLPLLRIRRVIPQLRIRFWPTLITPPTFTQFHDQPQLVGTTADMIPILGGEEGPAGARVCTSHR